MTFIQASSYKAVTKNAISVFHEIPLDVTVVLCYFKKCQLFGMERKILQCQNGRHKMYMYL